MTVYGVRRARCRTSSSSRRARCQSDVLTSLLEKDLVATGVLWCMSVGVHGEIGGVLGGGGRTGDLACSAPGQSLGPGGNSDVPRGVLHTTSAHESCAGRLGWRGATQQWPSRSAAIPDDPNHRCALSALGRPPASLPKKKAGKDVRRVMSSSEGGRESVWVPTSSKNWVAS